MNMNPRAVLAGLGEGQSWHMGACLRQMAEELPWGWSPPAKSQRLQHHGREMPSNAHPREPEHCQLHLWGRKWENRVGQLGNAALCGALGFGKWEDGYKSSKLAVHLWDCPKHTITGARAHCRCQEPSAGLSLSWICTLHME